MNKDREEQRARDDSIKRFAENQDGVSVLTKRKISACEASDTHLDHRKKILDETNREVRLITA